eukprot:TRINITY_DN94187_c0_g1_i1.p1 TRINITY_DN94187_c0_g1~~TRINITY_DN94187_c0_g1_i1.p1  ORF type:complete len:197 (+),score=18.73 TRINITY_DN94187_c0_g1_i1:67-591(+)
MANDAPLMQKVCGPADENTVGYIYDFSKASHRCQSAGCGSADKLNCCKPSAQGSHFTVEIKSGSSGPNKKQIWAKFKMANGDFSEETLFKDTYSCSCPGCSWCKGTNTRSLDVAQTDIATAEFCMACGNDWGPGQVTIWNTEGDGQYKVTQWDVWGKTFNSYDYHCKTYPGLHR